MNKPSRILLVEDEDIVASFIEMTLVANRYEVTRTADAASAWRELEHDGTNFGIILLDRHLPDMDGMALMQRIKENAQFCNIPLILETAADEVASIHEGLQAGAYYYRTKPLQPRLLLAVTGAALAHSHQLWETTIRVHETSDTLAHLESGVFRFRTLADAHTLAYGLAHCCPNPAFAAVGLLELLVNAVEHGNLEISYEEKTKLILENRWQHEVERRLMLPRYRERHVTVALVRDATALTITIRDQGAGFHWQKYLEFDAKRAFDPNGRGIALARKTVFDVIEYQGNGNQVSVTIANQSM